MNSNTTISPSGNTVTVHYVPVTSSISFTKAEYALLTDFGIATSPLVQFLRTQYQVSLADAQSILEAVRRR